jgi:PAS domain S-box-containing protein
MTAGYSVAELRSDFSGIEEATVALIDATLLRDSDVIGVPAILLASEDYGGLADSSFCPEAIIYEPVRGRDLENAVEIFFRKMYCDANRAVVQGSRDYALFMLDAKGMIVSWNPGATAVHEYEPREIIGKHYSVLYPEEDRASGVPEAELRTAASEGTADDTRWLLRRTGERFWAEGLTTAIKNRRGDVTGYAKITRDATERRSLETQLQKSNDELQRFAYTVSHDLQEPLRTIRSYAELLQRRYSGKLDSDADEFIHFMVDATARMSQLLKDLLAYSQAGRPDRTTPEPTAAANILEWAKMNVDKLATETGATITHDPLPMVEADQTQLAQVFQNLLGNAIKYRSQEPPHIHVSAVRQGDFYEFSVTDNGIGVEPEHHERIFGVFKRLHGKEVPGTGIGLAICRKIIESHGGRIWIESEPGHGSTMKFTLRAHE